MVYGSFDYGSRFIQRQGPVTLVPATGDTKIHGAKTKFRHAKPAVTQLNRF